VLEQALSVRPVSERTSAEIGPTVHKPTARMQPHLAHVPGPDGKRREIDLAAEVGSAGRSERNELAELVAAHEPWMRALASSRIPVQLRARFDGDDVVQSAFLALCERADAGQAAVEGNVKGYLGRAVRNSVCDEVRRHTRSRRSAREECAVSEIVLDRHVCPREQPLEAIEKAELRAALVDALEKLSDLDRRLVHLKYVEQMSWIEIGRLLEMPETTARRKGLEAFGRLMRLVE
jgi:RNA polymerase sigma factor (sigma-70 family)